MNVAGNAAGDAAAGAGATAATTKALQLPPNTKNSVIESLTSAQEQIATIVTAMQDSEEVDGAVMPEELPIAIDQVGMSLCALAAQFAPAAQAGPPVAMSAAEVEIANALADGAHEIAKALLAPRGDGVKKATVKVAPAHVVSLIKELLDDFVGRASKWGGMFTGEAPAAASATPAAAPAAKNSDAKATLKNIAAQAGARVAKALGSEQQAQPGASNAAAPDTSRLDVTALMKAIQTIPDLDRRLARLQKSIVDNGVGDPIDGPALEPDSDIDGGDRKFEPGQNIAERVRKSLARGGRKPARDEDEDEDVDFDV